MSDMMDNAPIVEEGADTEDAFGTLEMVADMLGVHVDRTRSFNNACAYLILKLTVDTVKNKKSTG